MNIDFIAREMISKIRKALALTDKRVKIISGFVIRRAKEVNGRLDRLEVVAGQHSRGMSSLGRSMAMCSELFDIIGKRIDKVVDNLRELEVYSRKSMNNIKSIEEDMEDRSSFFNTMWKHIRRTEGEVSLCNSTIRRLQDKVDALEKLHTTKIKGFEYSEGPPPSLDALNRRPKGEVAKF